MSYDTYEISNQDGSPIRLYEFERASLHWYYTSADRDITWNGKTYTALPASDQGITQSGEAQSNTFNLTLPAGNPVVEMYRNTPPSDTIYLTVRNTHEFDSSVEAPVQWVGYITDVQRPTSDSAVVVCAALSASFTRPGLRLTWMRTCPNALYDDNCGVNKNAYVVYATIGSMDGTTVFCDNLANYPQDHFSGGFVEWELGVGVYERRGIERYSTDGTLYIFGRTDGMSVGQFIRAYPGCARTIDVCNSKFNNLLNYGGIKDMPGISPFDGAPIF